MKYFLHSSPQVKEEMKGWRGSTEKGIDSVDQELNFVIAGPFMAVNSLHQWRRVTLEFSKPLPEGASVELATMSHEAIEAYTKQRFWFPSSAQAEKTRLRPRLQAYKVSKSAIQRDGIFGAVKADDSISRTPLLKNELARWFARELGLVNDDGKNAVSDEEILSEFMRSIRQYPLNSTDITVWHQPGKRQGRGTQLWVFLRIGCPKDAGSVDLKCIEVESQESGWERELPQIYQELNTGEPPQHQSIGQTGMPILLESLLRQFEFNAETRREKIQRVADWYVPSPQTTRPAALVSHLGVQVEGLKHEEVLKSLHLAFRRFLTRGTKDAVLGVLKEIYGDEDNQAILDLYEPIKKCRIMVLDDPLCRLDDPNVILSGTEPRKDNDTEMESSPLQLTGMRHLVGRAILRVNATAFPQGAARVMLRELVDSHAPTNIRIVIEYVGDPAVLGHNAVVGESTIA